MARVQALIFFFQVGSRYGMLIDLYELRPEIPAFNISDIFIQLVKELK